MEMPLQIRYYYYYYYYYYIIIIIIQFLYLNVFFDGSLLPVFYANREPLGKMLTLIDFAFKKKLLLLLEKHLLNNDYD